MRRLLLVLLAASPCLADDWMHVRAADLADKRLTVAGRTISTTQLLGGADPAVDGLWVQVPEGTSRNDLAIEPPLADKPHVHVVKVPPGLSSQWNVVPVSPTAYALGGLAEAESLGISASRGGYKGSLRPRHENRAVACSAAAPSRPPTLPARIADFEDGPLQALGNRFGLFSGRGGEIRSRRVRDAFGARLALETTVGDGRGFAGLWVELGAFRSEADTAALPGLRAVVVRGRGHPRGVVKLSDVTLAARDESVVLGTLAGPAERDGGWSRRLPVDAAKLDVGRLRSLVIDLSDGTGAVEIDEIVLVGDGEAPAPYRSAKTTAPNAPRATWAWHTRELLGDPAGRERLLATAHRWNLGEVYLQLPHASDIATISDGDALASLVTSLHGAGLKVHALDGAPWLALAGARPQLVGLARSVAAYNAARPPAARFDALHLDVEPYLLSPFGSSRRGELLGGFLASLGEVRRVIGALPLWLDVPFWFDGADEGTTVESGPRAGCAKPDFLHDALGIADGLVVMSYRTRADAADGLAAVALGELARGREAGKPVRLGVETIALGPERGWRVDLAERLRPAVGQPAVAFVDDGYVLFTTELAAGDVEKLEADVRRAEYSETAPPAKITFHGRTKADIEATVAEALDLARRAGTPADGIAFHEVRTLP